MSAQPNHPATGKRLRIAVLNRVFSPTAGGAERYSIALVEHVSKHHDVHVFAQDIQHNWPGVNYHKVPILLRRPRWINQLMFAAWTWWATRRGFDVVHSHENTWHGQVQTIHVVPLRYNLFVNRTGFKKLLRWLKVMTSLRLLTYLWLEWRRYAIAPGKVLVATSTSLQDIMHANYPQSGSMLALIEPGVNQVPGRTAIDEKTKARAQLALPQDAPCLLFVGNDYEKKGLGTLLTALANMPSQTILLVVGNASHIPKFKALAESLGLAQRVFFAGALLDVNLAYRAADCLVHPTLEDTYAMVVLEAMAHGLPVVVSSAAYCGIARSLMDGKNVLILKNPQDLNELSLKMNQVFANPALKTQLEDGAIEFAKAHLWSVSAKAQESVYQAVVATSP